MLFIRQISLPGKNYLKKRLGGKGFGIDEDVDVAVNGNFQERNLHFRNDNKLFVLKILFYEFLYLFFKYVSY